MRVLVTGGAGFIGSNFIRHLLHAHPEHEVIAYDALTYAGVLSRLTDIKESFPERFSFVEGDICTTARVEETLRRFDVEAIVHFAAESHVDRSLNGSALFVRTNVLGTSVMLDCAVHCDIQRFVHISTDEVYGEVSFGSVKEDALLMPRNPYAGSKAAADAMVMAYHATFGLPVCIMRSSNNYGPWQHPEKFIAKSAIAVLQGYPIPLHGDGQHMRDWIWVLDNCEAIDMVLHRGVAGEIYNVSGGNVCTNRTIAEIILSLLGYEAGMVEYIPDRKSNDRRYAMDSSRLRSLGWAPTMPLREGLLQTIGWYKGERDWWAPLISPIGKVGLTNGHVKAGELPKLVP